MPIMVFTEMLGCRGRSGEYLTAGIHSPEEAEFASVSRSEFAFNSCHFCIYFSGFFERETEGHVEITQAEVEACLQRDLKSSCEVSVRTCCQAAIECCIRQVNRNATYRNSDGCPTTWDGISCIDGIQAGAMHSFNCPSYVSMYQTQFQWYHASKNCTTDGVWLRRGVGENSFEYTDYTDCVFGQLNEVISQSNKSKILFQERILTGSLIGFCSLSLLLLLLALIVILSQPSVAYLFCHTLVL
ncbi:hypothetical protein Ciccas_009732 [Cichlidogyrus casuarinus]|uniref:G-protein coupled receptors family 2 profile 1 domain-containing protein n=1 Tax=Cichlidogyrus casuarinus TaxID=1844966 RepID=A0ABD2PXZ3_9PLAT